MDILLSQQVTSNPLVTKFFNAVNPDGPAPIIAIFGFSDILYRRNNIFIFW